MSHIVEKVQAVADLREPIREDKSFFDGANMGDLIRAAMAGESVTAALEQLSDRFIAKHQGQAKPAIAMGRAVAKAIDEGEL